MITKEKIREISFEHGVDLFGVASVDRFENAPEGFHPKDVYPRTKSVFAFAIALPAEVLNLENPIPYTHANTLAMRKMDAITYEISMELEKLGLQNILIPTDDPYLAWDEEEQEGRGILSLRHIGYFAGLGRLGRNNLLINKDYGNMIQIGAVLVNYAFDPDPIASYEVCSPDCRICLNNCPQEALNGTKVFQKSCRPLSNFKTNKGYIIKKCYDCRRNCPNALGLN